MNFRANQHVARWQSARWLMLLVLLMPGWAALAQHSCLLVPVPLTERLARAAWVVEARADAPQAVRDARGHLLTRYSLEIFKVFRGAAGAVLPGSVLLAGGTLGNQYEVVSSSPHLTAGQQGIFFLEPDFQHPGEWRLFAGPQGLIGYNLAAHSAAEPFAAYAAIEMDLYPALRDPTQAADYRLVRANAALAAPVPVRRTAATAVTGFLPTTIKAGTGAVLTIQGSNFGTVQGSSTVQFLNADNGGISRVRPLDSDYLGWTDTQIRVRVPSVTVEGSPAGSGLVAVVDGGGAVSSSSAALTISYAITNLSEGSPAAPLRPKLISANGSGGYTLSYGPSFQANANAMAAFERSLAQWACNTGANRITNNTASTAGPVFDGTNLVTFDNTTTPTLPNGVLGVTYSYYAICSPEVTVPEMDFVFANRADWNFGPQAPAVTEYDFESVALHEQGHGIQLGHVIKPGAVMHFNIGNGKSQRTLGTTDDLAGGRDEVAFSATANSASCGTLAPAAHKPLLLAGCSPLPVELVSFEARYAAGWGATVIWTTASERNSDYFAVEAQENSSSAWVEVLRRPAAGSSTATHTYAGHDPRLLSGTRYYRLRQVDMDGRTSYSPVVAVMGAENGLALYPNPVTDRLQVSGPATAGRLLLRDLAGRVVNRIELKPGPNDVDVAHLRPGLYLVEWTDGHTTRRGRLQKQ